jgi:amino acid adenylation domain-containing protein
MQMQGYRLSPQQSRVWSLQRDAQNYYYCAQCAVVLSGELKLKQLRAALERVVARHEILRTRFQPHAGLKLPLQVINESAEIIWREMDASNLGGPEQESKIDEIFAQDAQLKVDFNSGKLLRASLVKLSTRTHALIISLPSLCADALTLKNLVRETALYYGAQFDAETLDEPMQYVQFSEWQNELLDGDDADAGKEFWRRQASDGVPSLTLPFEQRPAADAAYKLSSLTLPLDSDVAAKINVMAGQLKISVALVYLACWQILLWRLTGQPDAVITGFVFDGRKYEELSGAPGLFARTLPVRCNFKSKLGFVEVLNQLQETTDEMRDWQEYFAPSVDANRFVFEFNNLPAPVLNAGLSFQLQRLSASADRSQIKLNCSQSTDAVHLEFLFNSQRHRPDEMQRLAQSYRCLLRSVVRQSDNDIAAFEIVDEQQQQKLRQWNQTEVKYPDTGLSHELFEQQAARTPDAVALVSGPDSLSYRQLNERANQLSHHLLALGVGTESVVGILMQRSIEMVVSVLAVLKAGAAYLPLDPGYPVRRLSFMLEDAQPVVLLRQSSQDVLLDVPQGIAVVVVDEQSTAFAGSPAQNPALEVSADNLAYVIYTSGSTGTPKGVMITHRGLSNYLSWSSRAYGLSASQGTPLHSSLSFDLSVTALFNPLITGGWVHLLAEERGIELLSQALRGGSSQPFSLVKITPAHLAVLRQSGREEAVATQCFVIGGEALSWDEVQYWRTAAGGATRLINEYGPTETVVGCCVYEIEAGESESQPENDGGVPIGRPIANMQMYVLDEQLRPVPIGVSGELYIGGVGLARGYCGRAELTAERFIPHPFSSVSGERLYRTGDVGRYLPTGVIEYVGRVDYQVKVRGYRIELGEIESVLREHEAVREAVVVAEEDERGHKRLVGYLISTDEQSVAGSELREHLGERLPEYMVPGQYVWLKQWPVTANGKVDRRALAQVGEAAAGGTREQGYAEPRTEVEEVLAGIWEEVLGVEKVGIHDNFFELGGDSIVSLQIIAKAGKADLLLMPEQLFQYPTVAGLASVAIVNAIAPADLVDVELEQEEFDKLLEKVEFEV